MKNEYIDTEAHDAMMEMQRLRHSFNPLTALFLVMDYTSDELEVAISKIDSRTIARLDIRFDVARRFIDRHYKKLSRIEDVEIDSSKRIQDPYTVKTAAKVIGVSEGTIRNAINNGKLKYSNVAAQGERKQYRISQKDVDEYIKHKP